MARLLKKFGASATASFTGTESQASGKSAADKAPLKLAS
jgi:hypothetical protein